MEEGVELAEHAAELWKTLEGKVDPHRYEYTLKTLVDYAASERSRTLKKWVTNFEAHTGRTRLDTLEGLTAEALAEVGTYNVRHFGTRSRWQIERCGCHQQSDHCLPRRWRWHRLCSIWGLCHRCYPSEEQCYARC